MMQLLTRHVSLKKRIAAVAVLGWGWGTGSPKSCPAPQFLIGSIVISRSHCCLPNDKGPDPKYFFLEPPLNRRRESRF